jgi:hypothetical protein
MIRSRVTYAFLSFTSKTLFSDAKIVTQASSALFSTSLCVRRRESENINVGIKDSLQIKKTSSIEQSWANSILDKVKRRGSESEVLLTGGGGRFLRRFAATDSKTNNKVVYRRRIEDMSWTKEPMDDNLIWVDCEVSK